MGEEAFDEVIMSDPGTARPIGVCTLCGQTGDARSISPEPDPLRPRIRCPVCWCPVER